jgi:DNA-binding NtrC family response regulator
VEAMRMGAYDFITKPITLDLVVLSVKNALDKKRLEEEVEAYHKNLEVLVEARTAALTEANQQLSQEIRERRKAEKELGWKPKIDVENGVKQLVEWVSANKDLF